MASWSAGVTIQLLHQECECGDISKLGGAPPLKFLTQLDKSEDTNTNHPNAKIKIDNQASSYFNILVKGNTALVLN